MKATPKLQDTLEIFLEQIQGLEKSIREMKTFAPDLESKIKDLKSVRIEPDLTKTISNQQNFIQEISHKIVQLSSIFEDHLEKNRKLQAEQKKELNSYYLYLFVMFLITCGSIYFTVKNHQSQSHLKDKITELQYRNNAFEGYIKESKEIDQYNAWLDAENKKKKK